MFLCYHLLTIRVKKKKKRHDRYESETGDSESEWEIDRR